MDLSNNLVQKALHAKKKVLLCICLSEKIRMMKMGQKSFYYLGHIHATGKQKYLPCRYNEKAVRIMYDLETPIREDLYDYFVNH